MKSDTGDLPSAHAGGVTRAFSSFLRIEAAAGGSLVAATGLALVLSNSAWGPAYLAVWETPLAVSLRGLDYARTLRS